MPDSEDISNLLYVYYSSGGATGTCKTLTTKDTTYGVKVTSTTHTIYVNGVSTSALVWNGTGKKTWTLNKYAEGVIYRVSTYGDLTYSTGIITRK